MIGAARHLIIALLVALALFSSAGCGTPPQPAGIQGKAWSAGGPYPGTARPDAGAGIVVHAGDLRGEIVAKTTAKASGAFKVAISPTFAITHPETITVEPGKYVTVRLQSEMH
jgi:hypothetical protein